MTASPPAIAASSVETMPPGLWCHRGAPPAMQAMHRHDDVEINVVLRGELRYVLAGRPLVVQEGRTAMFWAAQPHGLVASSPGDVCWVHVPVSTVMGWNLPEAELAALLRPEPLVTESPVVRSRVAAMLRDWQVEIEDPSGSAAALLEIQATVRRVLRTAPRRTSLPAPGGVDGGDSFAPGSRRVSSARIARTMAMAQFVIERHRGPLSVAEVAASVHLTPSHAMTVFRETVGTTIGEYVTMCRVAEAQRLLLTTELPMAEVAEVSGFGSLSSFYAQMSTACGMSPRRYRRQAR